MKKLLSEIAALVQGRVLGNPDLVISGISGIKEAREGEITFLANPKYAHLLESTGASAVFVGPDCGKLPERLSAVVCANASLAFSEIIALVGPKPVTFEPGIAPSAVIGRDVVMGKNVYIGPYVVIEDRAVIGDGCVLYPSVYVGHETVLGSEVVLHAGVSVRERVVIGSRVTVHCNSVIGSDGFGYGETGGGVRQKIPQIGTVEIGDDVEIGACVTIDRARFSKTIIRQGTKIDNLVQIAHNVVVGRNAVLVSQCGISGSSEIGDGVIIAGQAGVAGHVKIGANAILGARTGVNRDLEPNNFYWGSPAKPHLQEKKIQIAMEKLPDTLKELRRLKDRIEKLEERISGANQA